MLLLAFLAFLFFSYSFLCKWTLFTTLTNYREEKIAYFGCKGVFYYPVALGYLSNFCFTMLAMIIIGIIVLVCKNIGNM